MGLNRKKCKIIYAKGADHFVYRCGSAGLGRRILSDAEIRSSAHYRAARGDV